MNRRDFIRIACATGSSVLLPWRNVLSSPLASLTMPDRFFVILNMVGGWDTTLSLDPWLSKDPADPKDIFIEYKPEDLIDAQGLLLGPAMEPLKAYGSEMCIINGVFMSTVDNGHPASSAYIMTGNAAGKNPDLSVEINQSILQGPYGIISNGLVQLKTRPQMVSSLGEIKTLLEVENPAQKMSAILSQTQVGSELTLAQNSVAESSAVTEKIIHSMKESQTAGKELDFVEITKAAFQSGAAATAQITLDGGGFLDSHANHVKDHLANQKARWTEIAKMFDTFKKTPYMGSNLFDLTTFMVVSEFSRTPALNASNGKDHNPYTNSVLLAGRKIKGGQRLGASKLIGKKESTKPVPYTVAMPFDFSKELPKDSREGTDFIFPEVITRTVAEALDVNWGVFSSVAKDTKYLRKAIR